MEIPYTVTARPDTGLWNAKIGIWLFLASEVMLFGGLFSGYIFLRMGAEATPGYEWPTHVLDVTLGCVNTVVLIASSVTVILSWAQLKLHNFARFKVYMTITLLLACTFLVIKSFEYKAKLTHYGIFMNDGTTITGHELEDHGDYITIVPDPVKDAHGGHGDDADETDTHGEEHSQSAAVLPSEMDNADAHHEAIRIDKKDVFRWSNFGPAYNTFYAIYFLLTGLHGLHVLGGIIVLGYFLFFGSKMWKRDPERLANRVEVGGLFWHFVDLVWIFLFPILYLM